MTSLIQSNQPIILTDTSQTLSASDSGKIFLVPAVAAIGTTTLTLPTKQLGLRYKFIMTDLVGAANTRIVSIAGGAASMNGMMFMSGGAVPTIAAGNAAVQFIGGAAGAGAGPGDTIEVTCMSGTQWSVTGSSSATAAFAVI